MTTIATDGKTVAADTLVLYGDERGMVPYLKIKKVGDTIYGVAGSGGLIDTLIDWVREGAGLPPPLKDYPEVDWSMVVISPDGVRGCYAKAPYFSPCGLPFAVGSGAGYALGAMHAGASPEEAVRISAKLDRNTGGEITVLSLDEVELREAAE